MKRYLPSRNHRSLWLSAAAVILIGLISTVSLMVNDPYDSLFKSYYSPIEEASIIKRGENVDLDIEITNAIQLYFTGDYSKSSEKFQRLNTTSPNNPIINFYLGLNMMALAQYGEAIIQFENYLDSFELFLPEVKWYLSLCYLKTRDVEKAKILIEELENYPGKLGEDSHTLNRKVERRLIK